MSAPKLEPCAFCGHPRHTHSTGPCITKRITGPASTKGRKVGDHYEHTGRTETPCPCTEYTTTRNGIIHA